MAKNSIFAYLLRSPWWISLIVAVIVAAVARYLLAGIFGIAIVSIAFPFLVISGMAAWRQLQSPSAARIEKTVAAVSEMNWREFSAAIRQAYERDGHVVTPMSGAADFILKKDGRHSIVCCKRWKAANHGLEPLRELVLTRKDQGASEAIYVALGNLSDNARALANSHGIVVMQGAELARLLRM